MERRVEEERQKADASEQRSRTSVSHSWGESAQGHLRSAIVVAEPRVLEIKMRSAADELRGKRLEESGGGEERRPGGGEERRVWGAEERRRGEERR